MAKLTVNQFCRGLKPATKAEFGCPNMKPEEAAVVTAKDKKNGAITAAASEIRAKRAAPLPSKGEVLIEGGVGYNATNPDIVDNSGGGAAIRQGGFGSRYQANDDFGGLTAIGSVVYATPLNDQLKLRFGAKFNKTELNPYFDKYQDPMTPHLSRTAGMAVVGIQKQISPAVSVGADLLFGVVKTSTDEKDAKIKTSDLAMATSSGAALDKWAFIGGISGRASYDLSSRFYMASALDVLWDSLSSDGIKNPHGGDKIFNIQTSGPTTILQLLLGVKF